MQGLKAGALYVNVGIFFINFVILASGLECYHCDSKKIANECTNEKFGPMINCTENQDSCFKFQYGKEQLV